jgi:hypothetical protein
MTQSRSDLKRVLQWHLGIIHVHGNNQVGTVLSGGNFLCIPAFMRV